MSRSTNKLKFKVDPEEDILIFLLNNMIISLFFLLHSFASHVDVKLLILWVKKQEHVVPTLLQTTEIGKSAL